MDDIFDSFSWHSSIGIDADLAGNKSFVTRIPNNKTAMTHFTASTDNSFLIHRTTRALWRISDDKKTIEPIFPSDVLTSEEAAEIMKEEL